MTSIDKRYRPQTCFIAIWNISSSYTIFWYKWYNLSYKNLSLVDAVQGFVGFYVEEMDLPDYSAGSLNYFISINENVQNSTKILYSGTVKTKTLSLTVGQSFSMNATSVVEQFLIDFCKNVFSGTPTTWNIILRLME